MDSQWNMALKEITLWVRSWMDEVSQLPWIDEVCQIGGRRVSSSGGYLAPSLFIPSSSDVPVSRESQVSRRDTMRGETITAAASVACS